jgi:hypothetical protein
VTIDSPKAVCVLVGKNGNTNLTAQPGGRDLIRVAAPITKMTIDENGEAFVEMTTPNFVVRGFLPQSRPGANRLVYPAKWLSIGGVYFLSNEERFPIESARDGKLTLDVSDPYFELADSKNRSLEVNCDDVTIAQEPTDELRRTLPPQFMPGVGKTAEWRAFGGVSFSATYDGPPIGKTVDPHPLHWRTGSQPERHYYTTVLETRGKKARIADRSHLAGWIDASALSMVPANEMAGATSIYLASQVRPSIPVLNGACLLDDPEPDLIRTQPLVCPRDVRLVIVDEQHPDRLNVMGTIPAGRPVRVLDRAGDLTSLFMSDLPNYFALPLVAFDSVRVAAPTVDLDGCAPTAVFPFALPEATPRTQYLESPANDAIYEMGDTAIPHFREEEALQKILDDDSDFVACYDEGLRKNPELWGQVIAKFVIGPTGRATNVDELESTIPVRSRKTIECVLGVLASLTFPRPTSKTKTTTVTARFTLQE